MDEGYDAINVARARDLAAGRALADLPPEAFTVRGSRSRTGPTWGPRSERSRAPDGDPAARAGPRGAVPAAWCLAASSRGRSHRSSCRSG